MEYGISGDLFEIPKAIFYLLKGDYRVLGFENSAWEGSGFWRVRALGVEFMRF